MLIVNGWLIYFDGSDWVMDDEVQTKYYFRTKGEAVAAAFAED